MVSGRERQRETAATPALTWLGHATVRLDLDGVSLLTDPLLINDLGPIHRYAPAPTPEMWRGVDVVLISHMHRDHLDLPSLRLLDGETLIVAPPGTGALLRRAGFRRVVQIALGEAIRVGPLLLRATPALHSGFRPPLGPNGMAVGYLVRGSRSVYFAGDTGLFAGMAALAGERLDLALLPVGGWGPTLRGGHMDPAEAALALALIRPRVAAPIHWGTFWPRGLRGVRPARFAGAGAAFAGFAAVAAPGVQVVNWAPGERVLIPAAVRGAADTEQAGHG